MNIKVALSSLQFNIIELVLVIRDALGGEHLFAYGYKLDQKGVTGNYHILMNNRANFNE